MDCPVAGSVIEQAAEIEDAGPLAVQVELVRQGELVALRDEFIAPGVYALAFQFVALNFRITNNLT